jgi:hypothetical protein
VDRAAAIWEAAAAGAREFLNRCHTLDAFSGAPTIHCTASSTSASEAVGVNSVTKARWASGRVSTLPAAATSITPRTSSGRSAATGSGDPIPEGMAQDETGREVELLDQPGDVAREIMQGETVHRAGAGARTARVDPERPEPCPGHSLGQVGQVVHRHSATRQHHDRHTVTVTETLQFSVADLHHELVHSSSSP